MERPGIVLSPISGAKTDTTNPRSETKAGSRKENWTIAAGAEPCLGIGPLKTPSPEETVQGAWNLLSASCFGGILKPPMQPTVKGEPQKSLKAASWGKTVEGVGPSAFLEAQQQPEVLVGFWNRGT